MQGSSIDTFTEVYTPEEANRIKNNFQRLEGG